MNQQKLLARIAELLARFKIEVTIQNSNSFYDINIIAEDVLIPILNLSYDCKLSNAKYSESDSQFPALDLLDKTKRIAFQITSSSDSSKVKHTLEGIVKNKFQDTFDSFYIYVLTKKREKYNNEILDIARKNNFEFTENNIIDEGDLFKKISSLEVEKIEKIKKILEHQFSDSIDSKRNGLERVTLNLNESNTEHHEKALKAMLDGAHKSKKAWLDKKVFFQEKIVGVSDLNQQYSIMLQIKEADNMIHMYDKEINEILEKVK